MADGPRWTLSSGPSFRRRPSRRAFAPCRFVVWLLGGFAFLALILSSLGIFGVISYSVNQRTQEIGIRMALGASPGSVQLGVIRQTMTLVSIGIAAGAAGAWAL